jgi:membrane protein implicated in regulation of membrane protease activity
MKLLPAIVVGFVLAFAAAFWIGYFMAMAIPLTYGSPEFYAAEFAGVIISMAVFYFAIRKSFRRHKRRESHYTERLA